MGSVEHGWLLTQDCTTESHHSCSTIPSCSRCRCGSTSRTRPRCSPESLEHRGLLLVGSELSDEPADEITYQVPFFPNMVDMAALAAERRSRKVVTNQATPEVAAAASSASYVCFLSVKAICVTTGVGGSSRLLEMRVREGSSSADLCLPVPNSFAESPNLTFERWGAVWNAGS
jgi:hypothetical protein